MAPILSIKDAAEVIAALIARVEALEKALKSKEK